MHSVQHMPIGLMQTTAPPLAERLRPQRLDQVVGQRYFPDAVLKPPIFYSPVPRGLESKMAEKLAELRRRNKEAKPHSDPGTR